MQFKCMFCDFQENVFEMMNKKSAILFEIQYVSNTSVFISM